MNFSSILDISSFFIGMIINLILVSLMCYYFKRKYEILEGAQTEKAKILYELLRRDTNNRQRTFLDTLDPQSQTCPVKRVDYTQDPLLKHVVEPESDDSESEPDSGSDSDSDSESDDDRAPVQEESGVEVVEKVEVPSVEDVDDRQEKSVSELKELLSKKGIPYGKRDSKTVLLQVLKASS